jgi:chromosome partitioning protein
MKTIAVANTKGGVAKTTTCLSLGGSLAEQGNLVLLVDLDPQAHLTSSLGVQSGGLRRTVCDVLLNQDSLASVSLETQVFGLDLAPANEELFIVDKMLYRHPGYEYRLRTDIENGRRWLYDAVIIDCPPTFGTVTINALTAADLLIIPLQCEHYAVQSLIRMLEMVRLTRRKTNARLRYRLLVTMFDMRNRVHPMILQYLRNQFPKAVFENVIQVDTKLRESPAHAKPITEYAPRTRAARQYRALGQELMAYLGPGRTERRARVPVPRSTEQHSIYRGDSAADNKRGLIPGPRSAFGQQMSVEKRSASAGRRPSVKPLSKVSAGDNGQ